MAVAEQEALEQMPRSQHLQLGVSSLLGAVLLLFSIGFVLGGLPSMWEGALGIQKAIEAGQPPILNEFLSDALLLMLMIAIGVGIAVVLRALERSSSQPGLRAGVFFGGLALYVVPGLITKLGWVPAEGDETNVIWVGMTLVIGVGMLAGVVWLFTRPGFGRWLVRIENQGWFSAIPYKGNQGVRVRRGTIIALLAVGVCGIITLVSHRSLGSGRYGPNDWNWDIPFTKSDDGAWIYLPIMHQIHITIPILLAVVTLWVSWRVVNWPAFGDFLIATEAEINKVSWTTTRRLKQDTIVVLVTVFLFTAFLFIVDLLWIQVLTHPWVHVLQVDIRSEVQKQQEKTQW